MLSDLRRTAPIIALVVLAAVCGYLTGRIVTVRLQPLAPMAVSPDVRPSDAVVVLEGIENDALTGYLRGEVRLFVGDEQADADASGAFRIPAGVLLTDRITLTVPESMRFVASRRGTKFYAVDSASARSIAPGNRVYFADEAAARAAGYHP